MFLGSGRQIVLPANSASASLSGYSLCGQTCHFFSKICFPFFAGWEKTEHWTGSWPASGLEKFSFHRIAVFCKRNPDTNKVQMNYLNIIFDPSSKEYERVTPDELGVTKSFLNVTKRRSLGSDNRQVGTFFHNRAGRSLGSCKKIKAKKSPKKIIIHIFITSLPQAFSRQHIFLFFKIPSIVLPGCKCTP